MPHIWNVMYIPQCQSDTQTSLHNNITDHHDLRLGRVTCLHHPEINLFVCNEQFLPRGNVIRCSRINYPLDIQIYNMIKVPPMDKLA